MLHTWLQISTLNWLHVVCVFCSKPLIPLELFWHHLEVFVHKIRAAVPLCDSVSLPLRVQYENVIVCRHPAAAASFIQVSSCPGKPVLGFRTLSEQVQWIIFLCTSLLKAFSSVIHLSILFFSLFPASRQDLDLSKLQRDTNRVLLYLRRFQSASRCLARRLGGRNIVITAHAVEVFTEVYQLIYSWSFLVSKKREVENVQASV